MRRLFAYGTAWVAFALLWAGTALPAFLYDSLWEAWQSPCFRFYSGLCHQIPDRSFWIGPIPLAVCHRCTGVLGGLLMGSLLAPLAEAHQAILRRHGPAWITLALLLMGLDWLWGWWQGGTVPSRLLTGLLLGILSGLYSTLGWVALGGATRNSNPTDEACSWKHVRKR